MLLSRRSPETLTGWIQSLKKILLSLDLSATLWTQGRFVVATHTFYSFASYRQIRVSAIYALSTGNAQMILGWKEIVPSKLRGNPVKVAQLVMCDGNNARVPVPEPSNIDRAGLEAWHEAVDTKTRA